VGDSLVAGRPRRLLLALLISLVALVPVGVARLASPPEAQAQNGLLQAVSNLVCPVITSVDEAVADVPGVSDLTSTLRSLVCNLGLLEFRYYTVWEGPGGERVEKVHNAIVGLPTLMNVDGKGGPDLTGTILPTGLTGISMTVQRTSTTPLPVSAEVLVKDPTGGSLGSETIAFGYDQLGDRAPNKFKATLGFGDLISPSGDPALNVDIAQTSPGDDTDIIASFFNGTPQARADATAGRISFANSPTALGIDLALADPLGVTLTSNVTGPLDASLDQDSDGVQRSFSAQIQDLPNVMNLQIGQADPRVVYTGTNTAGVPQTINHLALAASSSEPLFARARHLNARIDGLSSGTELAFDEATNGVSLNTTQPIGLVELFAGSDPETPADLPAGGQQGARIVDRAGDPYVIGARVRELRSLSASLGGPYTLHTETAGGPFAISALLDDLEANVAINDLPEVLDLSADLDTGQITYDGSAEIGAIDIDLASAQPLFLDANEVGLLLEGVPDAFTLNLSPSLDDISFTADAGIDKIEAKAKSPTATDDSGVLGANDSGAVLRKVGANTFVFARLFDLQEISVGLDPFELSTRMQAGRKFVGDVIMEQAGGAPNIDLDATIENLPAELTFGLGDDGTGGSRINYAASSPINRIGVNASGLELLPGADPLRGELTGIPTAFTLDLPASGPVASLNVPSGQIGQVRLAAGSLGLPGSGGDDGLVYRDLPSSFGLTGRLTAIRNFAIGLEPVALDLGLSNTAAERRAINLDAQIQDAAADPLQKITARLDKPSANTSLDLVTADGQPTRLDYSGSTPIDTILLRAENLAGLPLIDGELHTIPNRLAVCFDPGAGCQRANPHNIGRREASILSLDIDDLGTSTSPLILSRADIVTEPGADPIEIRDIRLRELGVDIGLHPDFGFPDNTFGHVFIDTDNRPFSIDRVTYDTISRFAVGTPANPAMAQDRLLNINGTSTFLGVPTGVNSATRGSFNCGGQRVLDISGIPVFGTINILDLPIIGQAVPLCS
jgi:hypothetical protein